MSALALQPLCFWHYKLLGAVSVSETRKLAFHSKFNYVSWTHSAAILLQVPVYNISFRPACVALVNIDSLIMLWRNDVLFAFPVICSHFIIDGYEEVVGLTQGRIHQSARIRARS